MASDKSLVQIVIESVAVGVISHPIVAGFYALSSDIIFWEKVKDPSTAALAGGIGFGYLISNSVRELHHRYKIVKK